MNDYKPLFHIVSSILNDREIDWARFRNFSKGDWEKLYLYSKRNGIVALVIDNLKGIPPEVAPSKGFSLKWISHALSIENQMKRREAVAVEFAEKLSERGIRVVVLKGLAFAELFPNPYHRESGDLDCYMLGDKELGDKITVGIGGKMEEAGYKHSHLYYKGLTIENHRFITNFNNTKLGKRNELVLQEFISDGHRPIGESKLLNPSADFNALFLIKHAQRHFIKDGIRLRHILDWAFFLKAECENVNWERVIPIMEECRSLNFAQAMSAICSEKLGFTINVDPLNLPSPLADAVLEDTVGEQPDIFHENFIQKIGRFCRRIHRMWRFRSLADESYARLLWNNLTFNEYFNRNPKL